MTPAQYEKLESIYDNLYLLSASVRESRMNAAPGTKAQYRYPLDNMEEAMHQLKEAMRYDQRRRQREAQAENDAEA